MPGSSPLSSSAREQARDILSKPPFHTSPSHTPRPLAGVLHALGRALNAALGRPARWLYHHLLLHIGHGFRSAFGGWWVVVVGAIAIGLGVAMGVAIVRRRARVSGRETTPGSIGGPTEDPDDIERLAAEAESSGDHESAVRLRFRAGLLRLQRKGILANQDAQTSRQLALRLDSPTFDVLAVRHERIVYAGDPATSEDAASARTNWPRVMTETRAGDRDGVGAGTR